MNENEISYQIIGAAIEIHKSIGPGLLESAYESALSYDLRELGFEIQQQKRSIELAKKEYFTNIALGVGYIDTASTVGPMDPPDDGQDSISAVVSINVPIWRQKYAAGVQEARNRYYTAIHSRLDKFNILASEVKLALFQFRDAERKIDLYRDALLPKAKQS